MVGGCTSEGVATQSVLPAFPAWPAWVAELEVGVALSGACPSSPPEAVPARDGGLTEPVWFGLDQASGFRLKLRDSDGTTSVDVDGVDLAGAPTTCEPDETGDRDNAWRAAVDWPSYGGFGFAVGAEGGARLPLPFFAASPWYPVWQGVPTTSTRAWGELSIGDHADGPAASSRVDETYLWLCISDAGAAATPYGWGQGTWTGSLYAHVDGWSDDGVAPRDFFVRLAEPACVYGEEASYRYVDNGYAGEPSCYHFGSDCDGRDNDRDGVVDEGARVDPDGHGTPDCQEDWDDDGKENWLDVDVGCIDSPGRMRN